MFRSVVVSCLALAAVASAQYTWSAVNGVFSVNTLTLSPSGPFSAGQALTVRHGARARTWLARPRAALVRAAGVLPVR